MLFPRLVLLAPPSIDLDAVVCRPLLGQRSRFQSGDVPAVAVATGRANVDDLSSDLLLVPAAMRAAAQMLGGGTLIAAAPKRGWLLVGAGAPGEIFKSAPLLDAAGGIASRGASHSIAGSSVFFIEDGEVIGVESREGSSGGISLARPDETAWS